jgi:hypothetical protein
MDLRELASAVKARLEGKGYLVRLEEDGGPVVEYRRGLGPAGRVRIRRRGDSILVLAPEEVGREVEEALREAGPGEDSAELVRRAINVSPVESLVSARVVLTPRLWDGNPDVAEEALGMKPIVVGIVKRMVGSSFVVAPILMGPEGRAMVCRRCRLPLALTSPNCLFCGEPHGLPLTLTAKITSR